MFMLLNSYLSAFVSAVGSVMLLETGDSLLLENGSPFFLE